MTESAQNKRILVQMQIAIFKIPPCEDALVIGKKALIGKKAAKKMLDTCAPDQFELVEVDDPVIEALLVKKECCKLVGRERLVQVILEEVAPLMEATGILQISLDAKLIEARTIEVQSGPSD